MQINLQVRFTLETKEGQITLCFRHAVGAVMMGEDVQQEVDDFGGPGEMRSLHCRRCCEDRQKSSET